MNHKHYNQSKNKLVLALLLCTTVITSLSFLHFYRSLSVLSLSADERYDRSELAERPINSTPEYTSRPPIINGSISNISSTDKVVPVDKNTEASNNFSKFVDYNNDNKPFVIAGYNSSSIENENFNLPVFRRNPRLRDTQIKVAICHKSLFGTSIKLEHILSWVNYHHLLGVEKFFISYLSEIRTQRPGFIEALEKYDHIKMVENKVGKVRVYTDGQFNKDYYVRVDRRKGGSQIDDERQCLRMTREKNYTWVMLADSDEYLWFDTKPLNKSSKDHGNNKYNSSSDINNNTDNSSTVNTLFKIDIKTFLRKYDSYNYLSFGKWMYSLKYMYKNESDHTTDSGNLTNLAYNTNFAFRDFSYTTRSYCSQVTKKRSRDVCPSYFGRAKLIVRPEMFKKLQIHGIYTFPGFHKGAKHFHSYDAHFKEWPAMTNRSTDLYTISDETISVEKDIVRYDLHDVNWGYEESEEDDGKIRLYHDNNILPWIDYVYSMGQGFYNTIIHDKK